MCTLNDLATLAVVKLAVQQRGIRSESECTLYIVLTALSGPPT